MRPLNRPMFRYGGPIKEGVMSGIREPKKDGGMLLVGEHPKEFKDAGGREKHVAPLVVGAGMGLARLAPLAMRAARPVANFFKGTAPATVRTGLGRTRVPTTMERMSSLFRTSPAGKYLIGSPEGRLITGGAGYAGKAGKKILQGGKYLASSPLTLATAGYYGGKALLPDGTPDPNAPGGPDGPPSIINPPGGKKGGASKGAGSGVELTAKERRAKNVERYRDIMDIKGMNKEAAYDSLIAASQAVNQAGGDLKGSIKDGSLINQIIQSTSKAFDKPKKTKDAIDTLILKGEIEKDIKASDPSAKLLNQYRLKQMEKIDKDLNTGFAEAKIAASKNLSGQAAIDAAASVASNNYKGNIITKSQLTDVMEAAKGSGEISEEQIIISATQEVIKGKNLPDGDYTVGDVLVTITEGQVTDIKR